MNTTAYTEAPREAWAPANGTAPAAGREAIASIAHQLREERRWLALLRLSFISALLAWLLLLSWAFPSAPLGMDIPDYGAAMTVGIVIALAGLFSSLAFFFIWRSTLRRESLGELFSVVLGGQLLIRNERQFRGRLAAACRRARRSEAHGFSLIVVECANDAPERRQRADRQQSMPGLHAMFVRRIARSGDIVAELDEGRVAVLAPSAGVEHVLGIMRRYASALSDARGSLPGFADARIGSSTFGMDGDRPDALLKNAWSQAVEIEQLAGEGAAA